jgi:DNA modification methylase
MSEYQIYLGDCLEVMKQSPDASVDMVRNRLRAILRDIDG